jgi:Xaa-Pro aminopeptidase
VTSLDGEGILWVFSSREALMMFRRMLRPTVALLAILAALPALAWEREPLEVFRERRARLVRELGGDGVVVAFGFREHDIGVSTTRFRQNETFYYLTGWNEPDAMLLIVPRVTREANGNARVEVEREILFLPARNVIQEKWTGPKLAPGDPDVLERTGFGAVKPTGLFAAELQEALKSFPKIYTQATPQPEAGEECFVEEMNARLAKLAPLATMTDFRSTVTRLRMVKTPGEVDLLRKATEASIGAHFAAMQTVRPGVYEYQVAARMKYEFERLGCEWPGYPPIVGSGFFSTVLHYGQNDRKMEGGDVVVMDVAGAYGGYSSDITRTLPVSGKFTPRQKEIYEIVLGAQNAALAAARPGAYMGRDGTKGLHQIAYDYINSHGKDLKGRPLGQYFIHGLGHSLGLNVHDPFDYTQPLQPGMILTIEPGIYIPEENLGVRIEDVILITEDGYELLTRRLPRTVEEIERLMAEK